MKRDEGTTEIRRIEDELLKLRYQTSVPSLEVKDPPVNFVARTLRALTGAGRRSMSLYWLVNRAPNMVYVSAVRT